MTYAFIHNSEKKIKDFFYSAMNEFYSIELRTIFSFFFIENTWIKKKVSHQIFLSFFFYIHVRNMQRYQ